MRVRWPVWSALGVVAAGVGVLLVGPPVWLVDRVAAAFPGCLYRVRTHDRLVALTLDDGPDEHTTPLILAELRRHAARATFFLIGDRVPGREDLVRRLAEDGHELGNHFMHDRPAILLGAEELAGDLDQSHALLATYSQVGWARPGSGWYSDETLAAMSRKGYRCALGSVYPYDATIPSSAFAARYILRNVRPGAVIVLHDGGARGRRSARTLGTVLPELRRRREARCWGVCPWPDQRNPSMPTDKDFKRLVRTRMRKTGEAYTTARAHLLNHRRQRVTPAAAPRSAPAPSFEQRAGMKDATIKAKTGCDWERWVWVLDHAGAHDWSHRAIAEHVRRVYKTPMWWTQAVTVGYERIRGLRTVGQRRSGQYEAGKSKTLAAPTARVYRAFRDARTRVKWLGAVDLTIRTAIPNKSMRITWSDGTNVEWYFVPKGEAKCQVAVQHGKLPDREAADRMKTWWGERLGELDRLLTRPNGR